MLSSLGRRPFALGGAIGGEDQEWESDGHAEMGRQWGRWGGGSRVILRGRGRYAPRRGVRKRDGNGSLEMNVGKD